MTIIYWTFAVIYRIFDDSFMIQFDYGEDIDDLSNKEKIFFKEYQGLQILVEFFFVFFTFLSAIRGFLYGFSFIAFEENIFCNIFKKCCNTCLKIEEIEDNENNADNKKEIMNTDFNKKEIIDTEFENREFQNDMDD